MENQTIDPPTSIDLLRRAKAGDFEAFQQLILELQPRVYGLAFSMLRQSQDAEDATQQTFLSLIEHLSDFREESSLATWVLKIASNHSLKILRKKRGLPIFLESEWGKQEGYQDIPHPQFIAPWTLTPEELVEQAEVREEVERALDDLDEKYRTVFILRDMQGLSVRETAEALELTESTVKVRLLRARLALRERLTRKFGDSSHALLPDHRHS